MLNHNAFKMSLVFIAIIFLGILVRYFVIGSDFSLSDNDNPETASVACLEGDVSC
ncbi:hypothetical protein KC901_01215 [Patescibacteria group bacterium]|nr:hypothetical protein [Patescibacteria group bacterium]